MMLPILLILATGFAAAIPLPDTIGGRLAGNAENENTPLLSARNHSDRANETAERTDGTAEDANKALSIAKHTSDRPPLEATDSQARDSESDAERTTQGRKHKALFVDYPLIPHIAHYPSLTTYEVDYGDNPEVAGAERSFGESKKYQESNIFYIRLPPTPYMFVPGLGYISQPPTYSTGIGPKPQVMSVVPQLPQLLQLPPQAARPPQSATSHQIVNPFIKLPIDFVSNGKPTAVYQWHKKHGKKPAADSPIMNLDNLSADFVSNGKPTSIYQWQANLKPAKRPDDLLNGLDMGPYTFNGKLTSLYLLAPDGSTSMQRPIRYTDYQDSYRNVYY